MSADAIAHALGGAYRCGAWWHCRCPVHGSRSASLALQDGRSGLIVKCWGGCSRTLVLAELQRLKLLDDTTKFSAPGAKEMKRLDAGNAAVRARRIANALELWAEGSDHAQNLAEQYLSSRGITIPLPPRIRAHAPMRHSESGEMRPAMLALVEHVEHGPVAVHCTYLRPDGRGEATVKPNKKLFGPVGGAALRLSTARRTGGLSSAKVLRVR